MAQDKYDRQRKKDYVILAKEDEEYFIGDDVTLYNSVQRVGTEKKFIVKWKVIWIIVKKFSKNAVIVKNMYTGRIKIVNMKYLKRIHWYTDQRV